MSRVFLIGALFCLGTWLLLRVVNAIRQGEVSSRGRYEMETHYYKRLNNPYMFWQAVLMLGIGGSAFWVAAILVALGKI